MIATDNVCVVPVPQVAASDYKLYIHVFSSKRRLKRILFYYYYYYYYSDYVRHLNL